VNLNAFPFFDSLAEMKAAVKSGVTLKCPSTRFLPFQIAKPRDNQPIDCINVYRSNDTLYRTIMGNALSYTYHQTSSTDFITYYGSALATPLACGDYYLEVSGKYSAMFSVVSDLSSLLTLEWRNDNNLFTTSQQPVLLYSTGFLQRVHLEAEVTNPTYPYEETGNENEYKEFTADFKRVTKQSQFQTVQVPAYLTDALGALPMHSQVKVGTYDNVQGIEVSPNWLDYGQSASVTVKFSEAAPVIALGCDTLELTSIDVSAYTPRGFMCGIQDNTPYWQNTGVVTCQQADGKNTGYTLIEQEDINPQSPTYGNMRTITGALDTTMCAVPVTYYSQYVSEWVVRNNCAEGYEGSEVLVSVEAGAFTSYISQVDANNKALAHLNSIKQNYANTHGTCTVASMPFAGRISGGSTTASQSCFMPSAFDAFTETGTLQTGDTVYLDAQGTQLAAPNKFYLVDDDYVIGLNAQSTVVTIAACGESLK
jgi:hypothetical protein